MAALMIGMVDNDISKRYMDITIPQAEKMLKCSVEILDAVRPNDQVIDHSKFSEIKHPTHGTKNKPWSGTEKAVWYSHVKAWETIMDNEDDDVWVLEHDAYLDIPPPIMETTTSGVFGNHIGEALCYMMRKHVIERILTEWKMTSKVDMQVDTFMVDWFRRHQITRRSMITFKVSHLVQHGTTIEHK